MDLARWCTLFALTVLLAEGFTLSLFPEQFKAMLSQADPRTLQALGLVETVLALGLMAGIVLG